MNRFTRNIVLFVIPILLLLVALELAIRYSDNSFIGKAEYIENNKDIELLILGSSHNQGINIKHLNVHGANLAYGMQDYQLDSALFFSLKDDLPNLKHLILEFDYISLFKVNPPDYFRYGWYAVYHDIEIVPLPITKKYSMYLSSPEFFNSYLHKKFWIKDTKEELDEFAKLNYDEKEIAKKSANRMEKMKSTITENNFKMNAIKLESILSTCEKDGIKVILISNPVYQKYIAGYDYHLETLRIKYLNDLLRRYDHIYHLNFERNNSFSVQDYKDEDHLNKKALIEYTKKINVKLDSLIKQPL